MSRVGRWWFVAVLTLGSTARALKPPEPRDVSRLVQSLAVGVGFDSSTAGYDLYGELGFNTLGLETLKDRKLLLLWKGFAGFKAGPEATTRPFYGFLGGTARGDVDFGWRLGEREHPWNFYVGGRAHLLAQLMVTPLVPLAQLDTLNRVDGYGGFTLHGGLGVSAGASLVEMERQLLLTGFVQETGFAPGVVTRGYFFTDVGASGRFDVAPGLTLGAEGLYGFAPAVRMPLNAVDSASRYELGGWLRKSFAAGALGLWFSVSASVGRRMHHVVYLDSGNAFDSAEVLSLSVAAAFGIAFGGAR